MERIEKKIEPNETNIKRAYFHSLSQRLFFLMLKGENCTNVFFITSYPLIFLILETTKFEAHILFSCAQHQSRGESSFDDNLFLKKKKNLSTKRFSNSIVCKKRIDFFQIACC